MFPFTATEKDCLDADGGPEECVICMEDYEAGEKMARLPCWCKFHEVRFSTSMTVEEARADIDYRRASRSGGSRKAEARVQRINFMNKTVSFGLRYTHRFRGGERMAFLDQDSLCTRHIPLI
jgi:hypothetical protein